MWTPKPMRRADRAMPEDEALALLEKSEWGCLATADAEGLPLCTPLSFVVLDGAVYFHCAHTGHKLSNMAAQPRVSFCVVGRTKPKLEAPVNFTTEFESVVLHGRATTVQDEAEKNKALRALCMKYLPAHADAIPLSLEKSGKATTVVRIDIDQLTGKAKG